jgi:predicted mannosyl-3-phosphoglycerate phosphatase (HAD superfamily)
MTKPSIPVVVFAGIDATPARPTTQRDRLAAMLERLAADRIAIVFCSHGTRAEVESVRHSLGVYHPFVCENGSAAFVPGRYFGSDPEHARLVGGYHAIEFAQPYDRVVETLHRIADRLNLPILGFNDMSVEQVARECGLPLLDARLAKLREYAEPFRLVSPNGVAERRLVKALEGAGLNCVTHGDFHYAGSVRGAGGAAAALAALYRASFGSAVTAVLGDGVMLDDVAARVDVRLSIPGTPAPIEWLERIAQGVENVRETLPSRPVARQAR